MGQGYPGGTHPAPDIALKLPAALAEGALSIPFGTRTPSWVYQSSDPSPAFAGIYALLFGQRVEPASTLPPVFVSSLELTACVGAYLRHQNAAKPHDEL